jgi:hypothetical protein
LLDFSLTTALLPPLASGTAWPAAASGGQGTTGTDEEFVELRIWILADRREILTRNGFSTSAGNVVNGSKSRSSQIIGTYDLAAAIVFKMRV